MLILLGSILSVIMLWVGAKKFDTFEEGDYLTPTLFSIIAFVMHWIGFIILLALYFTALQSQKDSSNEKDS